MILRVSSDFVHRMDADLFAPGQKLTYIQLSGLLCQTAKPPARISP